MRRSCGWWIWIGRNTIPSLRSEGSVRIRCEGGLRRCAASAAQVDLLKLHLMTGLRIGLIPADEFLHKLGFVRRRRVRIVPPKVDEEERREKKDMSLEPNAKKARIATDSGEKEVDHVSAMVDGVSSNDPLLQLESITNFRKLLSSDGTRPTESMIKSGVLPRFVEFLKKEDSPKLQYEAAWIIKNIASDKPDEVIDHGAVPILVQLLASPNDGVLEQAICALGNVAGGSAQRRDHVLSCGVLLPLLPHLNMNTKLSILRIATWTLANLCRGHPPPPFDQVSSALPTLERLLHLNDEEVLKDACSAVWLMSNSSDDRIHRVIDTGFVPILVQLLHHTSPYVLTPVRGIICAILCIDKKQIQYVIDGGYLPILANLLSQDSERSIKQACWTIASITAGTEEHIQSVIDANLIPILVNVAQTPKMNIKMIAVWAIAYATSGGSDAQVKYLVKENCIKPLCDTLVCEDLRVILACLNGLENILKVGEAEKNTGDDVNGFRQLINDSEGQEKIKNLQSHDHEQIKEKAMKILETYWPGEEDKETQQPPK